MAERALGAQSGIAFGAQRGKCSHRPDRATRVVESSAGCESNYLKLEKSDMKT